MADRRMFSKRIINSARFLKMPISTQCLYFHLGLHADDDGIVEAYNVLNSTGATEDDLKVLVAKNFVHVLNEDLVTYITDWTENNKIRADRKVDSIYKNLLLQVLPDTHLQEKKQRADVKKRLGQPMDVQWTTNGQPMDGIGKDRLSKDSIGKDSIDIVELDKPIPKQTSKPAKHKYGEYQHVLLTDTEFNNLARDFSNDLREKAIKFLDEYIEETGYKKKSHYLTIRRWVIDAVKEQEQKQTKQTKTSKPNQFNNFQQRSYSTAELDALERKLLGLDKKEVKPLTDEELKEAEELKQGMERVD
jgi:hypothetical protein